VLMFSMTGKFFNCCSFTRRNGYYIFGDTANQDHLDITHLTTLTFCVKAKLFFLSVFVPKKDT
jgi:hypothetical protein